MLGLEFIQALELGLFFFFGATGELQRFLHRVAFGVAESVHADDGELAGVFEHFVVHAFVLNAAALVAGFHSA